MITIPIQRDAKTFDVIVVFSPEGIERLNNNDPMELNLEAFPEPFKSELRLNRVLIALETEANQALIVGMFTRGEVSNAIKFLMRGWEYRPDKGDSDQPYERIGGS